MPEHVEQPYNIFPAGYNRHHEFHWLNQNSMGRVKSGLSFSLEENTLAIMFSLKGSS